MIKKLLLALAVVFALSCVSFSERIVQAGVFKNKKDAVDLQAYLLSRNYRAVLRYSNSFYRVFSEPQDGMKADLIAAKLSAEDNISASVVDSDVSDEENGVSPQPAEVSEEMLGKLVDTAFEFLGVKYKWGGTDPNKGMDCSFFVQTIYKSFGVALPRTSVFQSRVGKKVGRDELMPGDLVFFKKYPRGSRITHVGIYIGDDKFIHAARSPGKVTVSSLNETYFKKRFCGGRRQL
jgi:cell wall-associated NlpC family hydrolase